MAWLEKRLVGEGGGRKVEENGTQQRLGREEIWMLFRLLIILELRAGLW